ncbi:hypothetical protein BGZ49_004351 [Haplosporangium sp. Z 27]|nr:hypothetical protein BGZ49_004351 [Haplosporangium sp. Z 27]
MLLKTVSLFALACSMASAVIINPQIKSPKRRDVWVVGSTETVTWSTKDIPANSQQTGTLLLGYKTTGLDEHLDVDHPLAKNFKLSAGKVNIKVPKVSPKTTYIVVLMGDSGNASPEFTIKN